MSTPSTTTLIERRVRIACCFSLVALAMIAWALLHPQPLPVIAAMSVGQGIGTLSLLFFVFAVVTDLRRTLAGAPDTERGPAPPASTPGE